MRNLALELRPKSLDDIIGYQDIVASIKKNLLADKVSNTWLFIGEPGTGKTTFVDIISRMIQPDESEHEEVNGGSETGVDVIRNLIPKTKYNPMSGKYRCIKINEIQKLTDAAQQALLVPTEDKESSTIWFFTTSDPAKINKALLSRCGSAIYSLKGLTGDSRLKLIAETAAKVFDTCPVELLSEIPYQNITSPRDIVNVVDMVSSGVSLQDAIQNPDTDPEYIEIVKSIFHSAGYNDKVLNQLKKLKPSDAKPFRQVLSGYGRNLLLTKYTKSDKLGIMLKELALYSSPEAGVDLGALIAVITKYTQFTK